MRIAVINGPNLNLLGVREPAVYGTDTLADIESRLLKVAKELGVELTFSQHNGEGEIVDAVHALRGRVEARSSTPERTATPAWPFVTRSRA